MTDIGSLYVGARTTTDQNHLVVTGGTLHANVLTLGRDGIAGSSGDAEVSGSGHLVSADRLTVAAAVDSAASLIVNDNATMEVTNLNIGVTSGATATVTLAGNSTSTVRNVFMAGDTNTAAAPQEAKLELKDDADLTINGTNAWVNLAGGETSFARWVITGDAKYQVNDPTWIEHTNTIRVTAGSHVARGYYTTGSIAMDATNSPTRVQIDGGEVRCCGSMIVGRLAVSGGHTPVLAVTFNQPISSSGTTVEKVGAGRVVFNSVNPSFFGTWKQNGGTFDIGVQSFAAGSASILFTKDTLAYSGPSVGTNTAAVTVAGGSAQKRVVVKAENDIVFAGGWNSTGGGIVKYGSGSMTIKEESGTYSLNTGSVPALGKSISTLPANGASPADENTVQNSSTAGAELNILDGAIRIDGAGTNATIVKCEQGIYIGTGFARQGVDAKLEINGCDFRADGTTRLTAVGYANAVSACSHPLLKLFDSKLTNHRLFLGKNAPSFDLYPTVEMENTTVNTESGFDVGMANDRVHPVMRLVNTSVKQYRTGYAIGHGFYRGFDVTLQSNALLNATWTSNAGNNWHGFQFQNPSWGTIRVESGSTLQTSRFEFLGTGTEALHVELVFDGGTLDVTSDASGNALSARTEVKSAYDAFVTTGDGMSINVGESITHTFAAPIKGTGDVRKTGTGTLRLSAVVDGGAVEDAPGFMILLR